MGSGIEHMSSDSESSLADLLSAIERNDRDTIHRLLSGMRNLNEEGDEGETALMAAASAGNLEVVRFLIDEGADVNYQTDAYFYSALQRASTMGHNEVVRILLAAGAEVDAVDDWQHNSLMRAAENGHEETVQILLEHNANPTLIDDRGKTAAQLAQDAGHEEIAAMLFARQTQKSSWLRRIFFNG
jgi:ankyrin repeat protein